MSNRRSALRALLAGLALSATVPGAWAVVAPRSFYADFPGAGHWVAKLPAYSEHLVSDAGAFYLAFALMFAWAALRPARALVIPLSAAWTLFSAFHLGWHVAHLDGFGTADAIAQSASLAAVLLATLAALVLSRRLDEAARDLGPGADQGEAVESLRRPSAR